MCTSESPWRATAGHKPKSGLTGDVRPGRVACAKRRGAGGTRDRDGRSALAPNGSERRPPTRSTSITWELAKNAESWSLNQNLPFNKIPR